jgi:hypothetical protein
VAPDPVPEADRLEQETPPSHDPREGHPLPADAPDADVLEQELPVADDEESAALDAERIEPVSDDDRSATASER